MARRKLRKPSPSQQESRRSDSTSPELGYQGEDVCEPSITASPKHQATSKKKGRSVLGATNDSKIIAYLEEKIADAFETTYNSMCEAAGSKYSSEILLAAFNKVEQQKAASRSRLKEIFFEKLQYRLSFMVESLVSLDSRRKVFRFVAKFSTNLWRKGVPDFMDCLLEFCGTLCYCEDAAVRQNICTLVGFLLKEGRGSDSVEDTAVSVSIRRKLYSIILERQLDKVVAVRAEVIQSIADIQDDEIPNDFVEALERSPKDVILMGFRDISADCRLTAVFALHVVIPSHSDYLIELESSDPSSKVRVAAIRQLAQLPLSFLSEQQRMNLLRSVIFDDDPSVVDVVSSVLIPEWISFVHRVQERRNKGRAEEERVITDDDAAVSIKEEDDQQRNGDHGLGAAAQGLLAMLDYCDDPEADLIARATLFRIFDVIRKKLRLDGSNLTYFVSSLVNDNTFPEVLSTHNYRNLLDKSLSRTDQAQYAFFWRVLIEYCCERSQAESERIECMYMLAPPLSTTCDLILKLRASVKDAVDVCSKTEQSVPICDIHQIAILHLLGILCHLDNKDVLGMSEWKCLLLNLLRDDSLSKEISDCIMIDLVEIFFEGKPEQFLVTVCDVTTEAIRSAALGIHDENDEPKVLLPICGLQPDDPITRFCMQLIHSMLRTGIFTNYSALLKKLYDDIVVVCFSSKNSQVYIWALEAAGILAALDKSIAKDVLLRAEAALGSHDTNLEVSATEVLTDLVAVYGYREIVSWPRNRQEEAESFHFDSFLLNTIKSKASGPMLCLKACECTAKIMLLESLSGGEFPFAEAIAGLISRLFHSSTSRLPAVKSCIEKFFAIFSAIQRKNQLAMIAAFHQLMSEVRNASENEFILHIDIVAALNLIVGATHFGLLKNAPDREEGSVQPTFLRELLEYQQDHPDDPCASLYWQTAAVLDLDEFPEAELQEAQQTVQYILDTAIASTSLKSKVFGEIQKFIRNVENALNGLATREAEDAERGDCLTELREKVPRTPRRGRKRTPKSTSSTPLRSARSTTLKKKTASSIKRSTQQVLDGDSTPSPPPIVNSLVTPTARSRPLLTRSAKIAAASKTRRWLFDKTDED